ncbi:hypothetical protein DQ244_11970 [Blastococcus sp. TBT05-19]|uniref:hypothetical protein n=1 Tax=Blastococcus sp. TBT05-19 TaxID=2250581 RepID=UPI000DEB645E|nr:hypothetical protein [Blastococcus sp. TBT05-19]RBY90180.1 hypothetical protein DQ244_11970 [Blastococcus sp. TBT05-19]
MERGTTTTQGTRGEAAGSEVDAAVARWAAAAGVPESVARDYESQTSFGRRVLHGFLLGLLVGLPLLALTWAVDVGGALPFVLVCGVLVLLVRIAQQRSSSRR